MSRMLFVNLPVADVGASRAFYTSLGFSINEQFSDEQVTCVVVSDTIYVMLLEHARFRDFVKGEIADARNSTEVLNCLSAESRDEVDTFVSTALANGGKPWMDKIVEGPMYGHSFTDPDGHVWEVMHMDMSAA